MIVQTIWRTLGGPTKSKPCNPLFCGKSRHSKYNIILRKKNFSDIVLHLYFFKILARYKLEIANIAGFWWSEENASRREYNLISETFKDKYRENDSVNRDVLGLKLMFSYFEDEGWTDCNLSWQAKYLVTCLLETKLLLSVLVLCQTVVRWL